MSITSRAQAASISLLFFLMISSFNYLYTQDFFKWGYDNVRFHEPQFRVETTRHDILLLRVNA